MGANVVNSDSFTLGSGILFVKGALDDDWVNVGQLMNDVVFTYTVELLKLEAGTPKTLITQAKAAEGASITGEMAEITAANIQIASGIADTNVDIAAASEVTIADEEVTFTTTDLVWDTGHTVLTAVTLTTAASGDSGGTTLVANTDYVLDAANGVIYYIASGTDSGTDTAWTDTGTYILGYTYTPSVSKTINFGGAAGSLPTMGVKFVHTRPDNRLITMVLHKAQTNGTATFTYSDGAWNTISVTFDALADSTKAAGSQLGYIEIQS
jgi:hypothetical protein